MLAQASAEVLEKHTYTYMYMLDAEQYHCKAQYAAIAYACETVSTESTLRLCNSTETARKLEPASHPGSGGHSTSKDGKAQQFLLGVEASGCYTRVALKQP